MIANDVTRRPITPKGQILLSRVEELIDPGTGTWDEQLVRDIFWAEDVQHILATPTSPGHEDAIAWHYDRRGIFSVKSVYHVLDDEKNRIRTHQGGQCSSTCSANNKGTVWRQLWRLPCPPKIKHFLWRLGRNSLPLKMNIQ